MTTNTPIEQLLAEAAEQIKREAYAAGWRACMAAITQSVSNLAEPAGVAAGEVRTEGSFAGVAGPVAVTEAAPGSTPFFVLQTVRQTPGLGSTQVVDALRESGHGAAANSIRTTLFRLKDRRLIVQRHQKWYPT